MTCILLVQHDSATDIALSQILVEQGYRVETAAAGEAAPVAVPAVSTSSSSTSLSPDGGASTPAASSDGEASRGRSFS